MIEGRLTGALLVSYAVIATVLLMAPEAQAAPATCILPEGSMMSDEMTIRETAQPTISGHQVGVSNIWERELPDEKGVILPRVSASLTIKNLVSNRTRVEKVFAGSVVVLDPDRYCVVDVEEGQTSPGAITLRKIP
jgi:hypothetical protein